MNNIGNYIKITKRKIHPNLQPQDVKEGDILRVVEVRGDKVLATHELKRNIKGKVYTVNPKRFEWKVYTDVKCLVQDLTSIESERIIQRMTTELTEEQIIKVAIVPLIIERVRGYTVRRQGTKQHKNVLRSRRSYPEPSST